MLAPTDNGTNEPGLATDGDRDLTRAQHLTAAAQSKTTPEPSPSVVALEVIRYEEQVRLLSPENEEPRKRRRP